MSFKYRWKELSDDGLLKEPKKQGPHYMKDDLNEWGGFDTEQKALNRLEEYKKEYNIYGEYILVKIY